MAGRGPVKKPAEKRARRNIDPMPVSTIHFVGADQPDLPVDERYYPEWHPATIEWWAMWRESPQSELFMASDWEFLRGVALLHSAYWNGDLGKGAELRLCVAKFGATPEDRARLKIVFADADEKDANRPSTAMDSRSRYASVTDLSSKTVTA